MKTLGRILIIVADFVLVMGITSVVVNSTSSSTTAPAFERGGEGLPQFPNSERPEFPGGERPEFREAVVGCLGLSGTSGSLPSSLHCSPCPKASSGERLSPSAMNEQEKSKTGSAHMDTSRFILMINS
jgi:hypothetical protein